MDIVHEEKLNDMSISIIYDMDSESPSNWDDNNLFLVGYDREFTVNAPKVYRKLPQGVTRSKEDKGYTLFSQSELVRYFNPEKVCPMCEGDNIEARGNKHYCFNCEDTFDNVKELKPDVFNEYHVFALSAYIHSGVRLYLGTNKVCQWDSGSVGAVLVSKEEWKEESQAVKVAEGLVESWNDYLSGNVYGYIIKDENGSEVDSCYGYYGDYKQGALVEARSYINHVTNEGKTDSKGQLLLNFA